MPPSTAVGVDWGCPKTTIPSEFILNLSESPATLSMCITNGLLVELDNIKLPETVTPESALRSIEAVDEKVRDSSDPETKATCSLDPVN